MVWARVTSAVSRGHTKETSLQDVLKRLDQQFLSLITEEGSSSICSMVLHINKIIKTFQELSTSSDSVLAADIGTESESDLDTSCPRFKPLWKSSVTTQDCQKSRTNTSRINHSLHSDFVHPIKIIEILLFV